MSISRYIVVAVVRWSCASCRLLVSRKSLPRPRWQWATRGQHAGAPRPDTGLPQRTPGRTWPGEVLVLTLGTLHTALSQRIGAGTGRQPAQAYVPCPHLART